MLNEYPRPQLKRLNWVNLNGQWDFAFDNERKGEKEQWYIGFPSANLKITVPYTYETQMSSIKEETFHPVVWYHRQFKKNDINKKTLLNFEGVDYYAKVWINGRCVGTHLGGYTAFTFDISEYVVEEDNEITVRVEDSMSCIQPRGKQRWKTENFGCWYVQTTGIWKNVWLEEVATTYVEKVKMTPDIDKGTVCFETKVTGRDVSKEQFLVCEVSLDGKVVHHQEITVTNEYVDFYVELENKGEPWAVALWSPENPKLYDVKLMITTKDENFDCVTTYFGMRKISIQGDKILLNNIPIYQKLILDQGYWEDSHLTPPSEEAIIKDIDLILAAGYNGVRKHQKTEDRRFLYWCDKKGLLVWSEMAAQYAFNDDAIHAFTSEWMEIVEQYYNNPSIITWTVFNESWGVDRIYTDKKQQKFTESMYHLTKSYDQMRPVIVNDGWEHTISDIITLHDYEESGEILAERYKDKEVILENRIAFNLSRYAFAKGYEYKGQPVIISEYGGIAFSSEDGWGYGNQVKTEEDFMKRFDEVTTAIKKLDYVVGYCYTQITDVQQEINGLFTIQRDAKVDIAKIKEINER